MVTYLVLGTSKDACWFIYNTLFDEGVLAGCGCVGSPVVGSKWIDAAMKMLDKFMDVTDNVVRFTSAATYTLIAFLLKPRPLFLRPLATLFLFEEFIVQVARVFVSVFTSRDRYTSLCAMNSQPIPGNLNILLCSLKTHW